MTNLFLVLESANRGGNRHLDVGVNRRLMLRLEFTMVESVSTAKLVERKGNIQPGVSNVALANLNRQKSLLVVGELDKTKLVSVIGLIVTGMRLPNERNNIACNKELAGYKTKRSGYSRTYQRRPSQHRWLRRGYRH